MIIVKSPLRISIGGGGTDLPEYYQRFESNFLSAAIDKFVYVTIINPFEEGFYLKYSSIEKVNNISKIKHPIFRETLKKYLKDADRIEITALADVPSGTGVGSSGSFTTALIFALLKYQGLSITPYELAEAAYNIERVNLSEPIGKQDQYIAAFGGIKRFHIEKNGKVTVSETRISTETLNKLNTNLLLFFTGYSRDSKKVLSKQIDNLKNEKNKIFENLHFIKELGYKIEKALQEGDINEYGKLLDLHWSYKKKQTKNMSLSDIDNIYEGALKNGAIGGKLVGAGGGGFLMFIANDTFALKSYMSKVGLQELRFNFEKNGTNLIEI